MNEFIYLSIYIYTMKVTCSTPPKKVKEVEFTMIVVRTFNIFQRVAQALTQHDLLAGSAVTP